MENYQRIEEATQNFQKVFRDACEVYQKSLVATLQETIFTAYPFVEKVTWTQYANYFCDGGPCSFYVYYDSCNINDEEKFYDLSSDDVEKLPIYQATESLCRFLDRLDSDLMKHAFGDDQQITVHRDGTIENNYYGNHD